jgi:cell division protein FtsB
MKLLAATLAGLIVLIQYPLWLGKGGWLRVWELDRQLLAQQGSNDRLAQRNAALEAEVRDLRTGLFAVEERARYELGMVRPDEFFVHYQEASAQRPGPAQPDTSQIRSAQRDAVPLTASYSVERR